MIGLKSNPEKMGLSGPICCCRPTSVLTVSPKIEDYLDLAVEQWLLEKRSHCYLSRHAETSIQGKKHLHGLNPASC